jgi:hypothetical protein
VGLPVGEAAFGNAVDVGGIACGHAAGAGETPGSTLDEGVE